MFVSMLGMLCDPHMSTATTRDDVSQASAVSSSPPEPVRHQGTGVLEAADSGHVLLRKLCDVFPPSDWTRGARREQRVTCPMGSDTCISPDFKVYASTAGLCVCQPRDALFAQAVLLPFRCGVVRFYSQLLLLAR